jgi:hypothetical protein
MWWAGGDPAPAHLPDWPEDSLGDRFCSGTVMAKAAKAPRLSTAAVPDARVIASDPAHWTIALFVAARAVVLDGMALEDPGVSALLDALGPVAEASQDGIRRMGMVPGFFDEEGPVFFLGCCALVDAGESVIGEDPFAEVLERLGEENSGDPLQDLVAAGALPARNTLRARLAVLRTLGELCRSASVSVLVQAA